MRKTPRFETNKDGKNVLVTTELDSVFMEPFEVQQTLPNETLERLRNELCGIISNEKDQRQERR